VKVNNHMILASVHTQLSLASLYVFISPSYPAEHLHQILLKK